jgi:hypothetical protein
VHIIAGIAGIAGVIIGLAAGYFFTWRFIGTEKEQSTR